MNRLLIQDLHHRYGDTPSLNAITLSCEPGTLTCLLGPSGCGKSTLLRCIAGHERPSQGSVLLGHQRLFGEGINLAPERRHIGMVFQDSALFPHLNVWRNVAFGLRRLSKAARRQHALAALERFQVAELADRYPHTCSGGQQQRIALARSLAVHPQALLLDEPFSSLDAGLREQLRSQLRQVLLAQAAVDQIPTVMVTHDPSEALACADRIAVMRQGSLVQVGTPDQVWSEPIDAETMAFFSPVIELPGTVADGQCLSALGTWPSTQAPGRYRVVARASAILPNDDGPLAAQVINQTVHGAERQVMLQLTDNSTVTARIRNEGPVSSTCRWSLDQRQVRLFPHADNSP